MSDRAISVVIPVFNNAAYVHEAISTVLEQDHEPLEVVAVDDGSTDGSAAIVRSFGERVRYVYQDNGGIGSARNAGIRRTTGRYLAFLDADDRMLPGCLKTLFGELTAHPELDAVFAHVTEFLSPEVEDRLVLGLRKPFETIPGRLPTTMLVRREAFLRVGEFSLNREFAESLDWYSRALNAGLSYRILPDVLWQRRLHAGNRGHSVDYRAELPRMLKDALDRRRTG